MCSIILSSLFSHFNSIEKQLIKMFFLWSSAISSICSLNYFFLHKKEEKIYYVLTVDLLFFNHWLLLLCIWFNDFLFVRSGFISILCYGILYFASYTKSSCSQKLYHYNPTKKSMKKYITQPYKSNNNDDTIMISVYSDSEISILINKFPLKNIYPTNKGKGLYYHSRDRFYYQKTLFCFFALSVIIKVLTLGQLLFLLSGVIKVKQKIKY